MEQPPKKIAKDTMPELNFSFKRWLVVSLFFLTFPALGDTNADFHITCNTSVNSAQIYSENGMVYFRFNDSLGFKNFPIFSGTVTPAMMPFLKLGAEDLSVFDGALMVAWDRKACHYDKARPLLVMCDGKGQVLYPSQTQFTASGLNTAIESQERMDLSFTRLNFNLGLDTPSENYMHYFLGFPFSKERCTGTSGAVPPNGSR